ncbi:MAG TPA: response regulator [Thermoanaerobaculia bacterium]
MVQPSCPALIVHDDDEFRKKLIAALDQNNFTVTFASDGDDAVEIVRSRRFQVVILSLNLSTNSGVRTLEALRQSNVQQSCGVMILGDPDPRIRTFAPWADETLLKPVDAQYVATRALSYCACPA